MYFLCLSTKPSIFFIIDGERTPVRTALLSPPPGSATIAGGQGNTSLFSKSNSQ
ncbi:hypothetical protein DSECCO2_645950 [anaerobic digester metagenome]